MGSDDEDHTATAYGDEYLNEEEEDESEEHVDEDDVDVIDDDDDSTSSPADDFTIAVAATPIAQSEAKKPAAIDDSRRLFQRLWTDEDETELLQGLLDYTIQRGHHHHDTTAFYDQIKGKLQLEFNKNQLVEKIRRLKKKYRNALSKISSGKGYVFKSPHDQSTFDLSCKIWNQTLATIPNGIEDEEPHNPIPNPNFSVGDTNGIEIDDPNYSEKKVPRSRKRARSAVKVEENCNQQQHDALNSNVVEEALKSSLLPLFKELVNSSSNGAYGNSMGLGFGLMNVNAFGDMTDEKWRKQRVLELEVCSKRLELMQDEVKSKLEELRSMGN